jgi:thymidylate synthase
MQQIVDSTKRKQKLQVFDLLNLKKANAYIKENWATAKYLDKNDKDNYGNAYNYQRNLMEQQKQQLESQLASRTAFQASRPIQDK